MRYKFGEKVAVLYIWKSGEDDRAPYTKEKKRLSYYTSIPYISVIQNFLLPFQKTPDYSKEINNLVHQIVELYEKLSKSPLTQKISTLEMYERERKELAAEYGHTDPKLHEELERLESFTTHSYTEPLKLERMMRSIGEQIFKLTGTFKYLFDNGSHIDIVKIVTNDEQIPWEWSFNTQTEEFLSEKFACGITILSDISRLQEIEFTFKEGFTKRDAIMHQDSAIIFGDDCAFSDDYPELKHLVKESEDIEGIVSNMFGENTFNRVNYKQGHFAEIFESQLDKCRILHLTGHFTDDGLYTSEGILGSTWMCNNIFKTKDCRFQRYPIVFLNGCFSGAGAHPFQESGPFNKAFDAMYNLADFFMKAGASASIITRTSVGDELARDFAISFYKYLILEKMAIGLALQRAKLDIKEKYPGDMSWLFYILYGDPTLKIIY